MSNRSWKRVILGSIFLILSIFYTVLFFQHSNFDQMMIFNIAHLKSLGNVLTSPINFNYWNHSGSQLNLFSPWLTILPGWLLVKSNVIYGFSLYLTLITFLTFVSAYFYMNKFSKDTFESLLFSVIYTFSLNRFWLIFHNQRLESYVALIFLPMIYYGVYQFFKNKNWHNLAWGLSLLLWTSPYLTIAVVITILPIFILMIFHSETHKWRYWGKLVIDSLLVLGTVFLTTAGFIIPLIRQQWGHRVKQQPIVNINYIEWFQHFNFNQLQLGLLLGIIGLLVLLLLIIFLKSRFSYKVIMLELIPLILSLLVKFDVAEVNVSRLIPAFQAIVELFVIIILSRIIILLFQEGPSLLKLLLMVMAILTMSVAVYKQATQIQTTKTFSSAEKINYQKFVVNYHDYAQNGQNNFLANGRKASVSYFTKSNDYWIQYYNPTSVTLDLPVQKYSGYNIQLNNETVATKISDRKTLQLQTQPGKNIIEIHSRYDWIGIVSLLGSLFGFILLSYLSLKNRRWKKKIISTKS